MPLTPEDVRNKQFSTVKFKEGYAEEEVDSFLDEIEAELGRLLSENEELRTRLAAAQQQVAAAGAVAVQQAPQQQLPPPMPVPVPAPAVPSADVVGILEMAQRTANDTVLQARGEAQRILAEAQETHRQTMGGLESERLQLQGRVDDLRNFEREYRTRMTGYLEAQLRDLNSRGETPPPAPSAALAPGSPAAPMPATPVAPQMQPMQQPPQVQQPPMPPQMAPPMQVPQVQPPQQQNPAPRPAGPFTPAPQPPMPPASRPTVPGQPDQQPG
jgi:DivIVA domain-containing protein